RKKGSDSGLGLHRLSVIMATPRPLPAAPEVLMSSPRPLTAGLVLALLASGAASGPPEPAAIDAVVQASLKAWKVPGAALAIVRDGELVYLHGYGVRGLEDKQPVTPDTIFPIASCTKAFTATAVAMLVDEGKMAW